MPAFSPILDWTMAIITLLVMGSLIYLVIRLVPKGRLVRCPEAGTVTFVEIARASHEDGTAPRVVVEKCALWPEHNECDRGCLVGQKWGEGHPSQAVAKDKASPVSLDSCV